VEGSKGEKAVWNPIRDLSNKNKLNYFKREKRKVNKNVRKKPFHPPAWTLVSPVTSKTDRFKKIRPGHDEKPSDKRVPKSWTPQRRDSADTIREDKRPVNRAGEIRTPLGQKF